ncbi:phosphotransferase [Paenibacillus sacheonensis]|uniref:Phosphotransferase n=1 Tax=Paenibacillus sacheonensis TaxID=742054 RepID=A0A7X5C182_9BACL|nr:phosphotransferase [Paenibacillus sacheonensis]MBM7565219.1 Ser/Thr protein kinase RdoA (MazF antagonist) [Paenibacillus sacheonensis]NBC70005.1 phosphotransferase [Paenibacillus sacheonensis]
MGEHIEIRSDQDGAEFARLCANLQLGALVRTPHAVTGGLLHRMYALETTAGKFAVKALNPHIMTRPEAMRNFLRSEEIAAIAARTVPALPAKRFNGTSVQHADGRYYLVFDWVEGRSLKPSEITVDHCETIGGLLADIHWTDFSLAEREAAGPNQAKTTDWRAYLQQGQAQRAPWADAVQASVNALYDWEAQANHAARLLAADTVISHLDLDAKNVLWNQDGPILIDWEASGSVNPMQNLSDTAVYWSEDGTGDLDKDKFSAFVRAYSRRSGPLQADWQAVVAHGCLGMLGWLAYSLKRSLRIECTDDEEQQLGTEQATATLHALRRYADRAADIQQWLRDGSR